VQHAVQRVIEAGDETEWIFKVLAKEHTLPSAAVVCKTWAAAARLLVDFWRQNIFDVLVVHETTASSTRGQGISFYHPPSASALNVNGRELLHQDHATQVRFFHAGEVVKGIVSLETTIDHLWWDELRWLTVFCLPYGKRLCRCEFLRIFYSHFPHG
jgi:hypothetical protein